VLLSIAIVYIQALVYAYWSEDVSRLRVY